MSYHKLRLLIIIALVGVGVLCTGLSLYLLTFGDKCAYCVWGSAWSQNFSTGMFGSLVTFILIELLLGSAEKRAHEEKERSLAQAESAINKQRMQIEHLSDLKLNLADRERKQAIVDEMKKLNLLEGLVLDPGFDLSELDFSGANLRYAVMPQVNLNYASLVGADLSKCQLRFASLAYSKLFSANLNGVNAEWANFRHADLTSCRLVGATLSHADLSYAKLQNADMTTANLTGVELKNTNLKYAILSHTQMPQPTTNE